MAEVMKNLDTSKVQKGHRVSTMVFGIVEKIEQHPFQGKSFKIVNEIGDYCGVNHQVLEQEYFTADQYETEEKMTQTDLREKFSTCYQAIFTANFNKKPKEKDLTEALTYTDKSAITQEDVLKRVKKAFRGEERTLIGRLLGEVDKTGRFQVVDLEKENNPEKGYPTNLAQVDGRTLNWFIYKNVKYSLKTKRKY